MIFGRSGFYISLKSLGIRSIRLQSLGLDLTKILDDSSIRESLVRVVNGFIDIFKDSFNYLELSFSEDRGDIFTYIIRDILVKGR